LKLTPPKVKKGASPAKLAAVPLAPLVGDGELKGGKGAKSNATSDSGELKGGKGAKSNATSDSGELKGGKGAKSNATSDREILSRPNGRGNKLVSLANKPGPKRPTTPTQLPKKNKEAPQGLSPVKPSLKRNRNDRSL